MWIQNLKSDKLQQSMKGFIKLVIFISKSRKALEPFEEYVIGVYYNGVDKWAIR